MGLYSRRQLLLLLGLLAAGAAGLGVAHWRAGHPELVEWLERLDRDPARRAEATAVQAPAGRAAPAAPAAPAARNGPRPATPPAVAASRAPRARASPPPAGPLDLNRAGPEELTRLPGIGPVLAGRIVEVRRASGPFASVEDLRRIRGIGRVTLERLRPLLAAPQ